MRTTKFAAAAAVALTIAMGLTACSSAGNAGGGGGGGTKDVADVKGDGKTLTVWAMTGDYSDKTIAAINKEFEAKTGAKVKVQIQQWDGITTKISTALATNTPPDVLDLGNTQVASYAANGALLDLTPYKKDLAQGQTWLDRALGPGDRRRLAVRRPRVRRCPVGHLQQADVGRRRHHDGPDHLRGTDRGPRQGEGEEHRERLLGLLHARSVLVRRHAVRLGRRRRDRDRAGRHLEGRLR